MTDTETKPVRQKPRRHHRFGGWMLLSIAFSTALVVLAGLSLSGRELPAPSVLTQAIADQINAQMPAGRATFDRLALRVDERGVPQIVARNVGVFDDRGAEVVRLNTVGVGISVAGLFRGRLEPVRLDLSGAQMTLRRRADGQFDLSFGSGTGASGTLPGVMDAIDAVFQTPPLTRLERLRADELTITVEDQRSSRIWQITDGQMQVNHDSDQLEATITFDVFNGTEQLAGVVLGVSSDMFTSAATIGATFTNAAARDIALQSPILSFLGALNAPISGSVRAGFAANGSLDDLAGSLEIGKGALQPTSQTRPIRFDRGKAYFRYFPSQQRLNFSQVSVQSDALKLSGSGQAYLQDFRQGWPSGLVGQFALSEVVVAANELLDTALTFSGGAVDFRLINQPFQVDIGQAVLIQDDIKLVAKGQALAGEKGWEVAADAGMNRLEHARLMGLWPEWLEPDARRWVAENVRGGTATDIHTAVRARAGEAPHLYAGYRFNGGTTQFLKTMPLISDASGYSVIDGHTFSLALEAGRIVAPSGGEIELGGSAVKIPDTKTKPSRMEIEIKARGPVPALLSVLNEPPTNILRKTAFGPDLASGEAVVSAQMSFVMKKKVLPADVDWSATAALSQLSSAVLVPGTTLTAKSLTLEADRGHATISGPVLVGAVPADIRWSQGLGPGNHGPATVSGTVDLSQGFADAFRLGLPSGSLSGRAPGQFNLTLGADGGPRFELTSNLVGLGISIPALGWSKSQSGQGSLSLGGHLGNEASVDDLEFQAAGLSATGGSVTMASGGGLQSAEFARVRLGEWLDAPVTLTGRGAGAAPAVRLKGGTIDIRKTAVGGSGGASGSGGPITLALDQLIISDGISLSPFQGDFTSAGGLSGKFTGLVNGQTPVVGDVIPDTNGEAIRIQSQNAGGVLRDAGVLKNASGGTFDLVMRPRAEQGVYYGGLTVTKTKVIGAPALTELLSAISIVGLLDQLSGPGISFSAVEAEFILSPKRITLTRSSAVGPSLGISLDGTYNLNTGNMRMQGVLSPVYFLNGIGQIFSRAGEGLFGFTFRLDGPADDPSVRVNPLSILTPGMFRDIFRRQPPAPKP